MEDKLATNVSLGWLWFDNDPATSLADKVSQAASRCRKKFGKTPRLCYVNPGTLGEGQTKVGRLQVKGARNILPGHFLFVIEEQ
ncbi:MAG: hypothetical protein U9R25_10550 [Chloroflexota bacterium]|nr:hypothetical protein [Chloroflexota bacterium]